MSLDLGDLGDVGDVGDLGDTEDLGDRGDLEEREDFGFEDGPGDWMSFCGEDLKIRAGGTFVSSLAPTIGMTDSILVGGIEIGTSGLNSVFKLMPPIWFTREI